MEIITKHKIAFMVMNDYIWATYDYDTPPRIPAFGHGSSPKKRRQESLSDALAGAAIAVVNALKPRDNSPILQTVKSCNDPQSPEKAIALRSKSNEQLSHLKKLHDEGVLDNLEYLVDLQWKCMQLLRSFLLSHVVHGS